MTVHKKKIDPAVLAKLRECQSYVMRPLTEGNERREAYRQRQEAEPEEPVATVRDRPVGLDDIVGQEALVNQLRMVCAGSNLRQTPMPHVLLAGPAGHGKTTLSQVVATELDAQLITTTGMVLRKVEDLLGLLVKCHGPTVLFIDEVHALPVPVMEMLYEALEDNKVSTVTGDGTAVTHKLKDFVCVGATTRPGVLSQPFLQRFGFRGTVVRYTDEELAEIVHRAWDRLDAAHDGDAALAVASRCRGVPRRALHLAERVLDHSAVHGTEMMGEDSVVDALAFFGIDTNGLEPDDYRILGALTGPFAGRTVGLDALSQQLNMDPKTLADQHEPWLMQQGLMSRTKSGRMALPPAYELVG